MHVHGREVHGNPRVVVPSRLSDSRPWRWLLPPVALERRSRLHRAEGTAEVTLYLQDAGSRLHVDFCVRSGLLGLCVLPALAHAEWPRAHSLILEGGPLLGNLLPVHDVLPFMGPQRQLPPLHAPPPIPGEV